jgi:hypothetical protein
VQAGDSGDVLIVEGLQGVEAVDLLKTNYIWTALFYGKGCKNPAFVVDDVSVSSDQVCSVNL